MEERDSNGNHRRLAGVQLENPSDLKGRSRGTAKGNTAAPTGTDLEGDAEDAKGSVDGKDGDEEDDNGSDGTRMAAMLALAIKMIKFLSITTMMLMMTM